MPGLTHRRSLMGYMLRPVAWQLMLASRLAAPSSNKLITSAKSSRGIQSRFIMEFRTDEGREKVQGWYKYQGGNTRFTQLEYRKVKDGRVKHEFIVARLSSTTLCRFDRRPEDRERGSAFLDEGISAEDSAHVLSSFEAEYDDLMKETEVLLTIKLPHGQDLGFILAVCEAIQTHSKAAVYNLMRCNCYFFSWVIVAVVARSTCNWETVVLSKAGWDHIIQTSFTCAFSDPNQPIDKMDIALPQQNGVNLLFGKAMGKLRLRSGLSKDASSSETSSSTKFFQDALMSSYSDSYESIQNIVRVLLLRSQLGPALNKELQRLEYSAFLSAKTAASIKNVITKHGISGRHILLESAAYAAAEVLAQEKIKGMTVTVIPVNKSWEETWKTAWGVSGRMLMDFQEPLVSSSKVTCSRHKAMNSWKNEWDKINKLSAQYTAIVTETITATMMEQLIDMNPGQLVFGNDTPCHSDAGSQHPKGSPSLQEFIRCVQDHFDMVDRFGFGSSQELVMTAEEAMCEIWIASLDIMESGRFRSQHGGAGHSRT